MTPSFLIILGFLLLIAMSITVVWRYKETQAEKSGGTYTSIDNPMNDLDMSSFNSFFQSLFNTTGGNNRRNNDRESTQTQQNRNQRYSNYHQ